MSKPPANAEACATCRVALVWRTVDSLLAADVFHHVVIDANGAIAAQQEWRVSHFDMVNARNPMDIIAKWQRFVHPDVIVNGEPVGLLLGLDVAAKV